jgi:hypothetical protein
MRVVSIKSHGVTAHTSDQAKAERLSVVVGRLSGIRKKMLWLGRRQRPLDSSRSGTASHAASIEV